jgi:pimeloyl-ACP methyl ester carboxylesterase
MVDPPFFAPQNQRNPSPPRASPREHSVRPSLEAVIARFRLAPPQACYNLFILDFIARRSVRKAVDAEGHAGWSLSFDPHFWEKFGRLDPVAMVKGARSPLAIIRGAKSQLFQPEDAAYLLSLIAPGSPCVEIPEAEHHVMIDQPLAFVAALRALLAAWPAAKAV